MTNRPENDQGFEAWAKANGFGQSQATSWARAAWMAAVVAERDRCAKHVANCALPGHSSLGAFQAAYDRIRSGVEA